MPTKKNRTMHFDVLIAGGSVAGAAAAAALSQLNLSILIVEPAPPHGRRLAGELMHPPGVEGLKQLKLLDEEDPIGAGIKGFAIHPFDDGAPAETVMLPYGENAAGREPMGLAVEHQLLKDRLLAKAKEMPGVTLWSGSRVTGIEGEGSGPYTAVVNTDGAETRIDAKIIIGADGAMSQIRKLAGIAHVTHRYSGMMGVEVDDDTLPRPGFGNIFLGPAGISYAYSVGGGRARIMFEILRGDDPKTSLKNHISRLPEAFGAAVNASLEAGKPMAAANFRIVPESSVKGNVVLMGDARGCCHPVTASGITAAVKDALFLRDAMLATQCDVPKALRRYAQQCDRLQLTRRTLAEELREAFLAKTPEAALLNQCVFSYWKSSAKARTQSMALLSTVDSSILSLAAQFGLVVMQSFRLLPAWTRQQSAGTWFTAIGRLVNKSVAFQNLAARQWLKERFAFAK